MSRRFYSNCRRKINFYFGDRRKKSCFPAQLHWGQIWQTKRRKNCSFLQITLPSQITFTLTGYVHLLLYDVRSLVWHKLFLTESPPKFRKRWHEEKGENFDARSMAIKRCLRRNQRLVILLDWDARTLKTGFRLFPVSENTKFFLSLTSEMLKRQLEVCLRKMLWRLLRRGILVQLIPNLYTSRRWVISFMFRVSYFRGDNHSGTWWRENTLPKLKIENTCFNPQTDTILTEIHQPIRK